MPRRRSSPGLRRAALTISLPVDHLVAPKFEASAPNEAISVNDPAIGSRMGLDIGPKTAQAYADAIGKTSTEWAPWTIVPANRKWYRDLVVAGVIAKYGLDGLLMATMMAGVMMLVPNAARFVSMVELLCTIRLCASFQATYEGSGLAVAAGAVCAEATRDKA